MIIDARTSAGLSQAELARRAGVTRSVMNVYERGRREPGADVLVRILAAAGQRIVVEPVQAPVDLDRAGSILEMVIGLAESLPYRPSETNDYPPLANALS